MAYQLDVAQAPTLLGTVENWRDEVNNTFTLLTNHPNIFEATNQLAIYSKIICDTPKEKFLSKQPAETYNTRKDEYDGVRDYLTTSKYASKSIVSYLRDTKTKILPVVTMSIQRYNPSTTLDWSGDNHTVLILALPNSGARKTIQIDPKRNGIIRSQTWTFGQTNGEVGLVCGNLRPLEYNCFSTCINYVNDFLANRRELEFDCNYTSASRKQQPERTFL